MTIRFYAKEIVAGAAIIGAEEQAAGVSLCDGHLCLIGEIAEIGKVIPLHKTGVDAWLWLYNSSVVGTIKRATISFRGSRFFPVCRRIVLVQRVIKHSSAAGGCKIQLFLAADAWRGGSGSMSPLS